LVPKDVAGYSETSLVRKLGIKASFRVALVKAPIGFAKELDLPPEVKTSSRSREPLHFAFLFVKSEAELRVAFSQYAARLKPAEMLWVAWPKKSSGIATDLAFNNVQAIGLASGLVDTKICAVDEVWSGLRFVFRLKDRSKATAQKMI